MQIPNGFLFLKSVRFWKLVIVAVAQVLKNEGYIDDNIVNGLTLLLVGDVAIRTVDRFGENAK